MFASCLIKIFRGCSLESRIIGILIYKRFDNYFRELTAKSQGITITLTRLLLLTVLINVELCDLNCYDPNSNHFS